MHNPLILRPYLPIFPFSCTLLCVPSQAPLHFPCAPPTPPLSTYPLIPQVFNEINARRINDELNVFEAIHHSPIFLGVIVVTLGLQAIIMQTKMGMFFKVIPLSGIEWGISIAIGASSIPISVATRLLGRMIPNVRRRRHGQRRTLSRHGGSRVHAEGPAVAAAMARRVSNLRDGGPVGSSARNNPRALAAVSSVVGE